jgi:ribosomal protein S18 acetylase RimI-like enzyme
MRHMNETHRIRPITKSEYGILTEFLYLAVFVPPGSKSLPREVIYEPGVYAYIDGFGDSPDDICFVAEVDCEEDGEVIAAAWSRILAEPGNEGYGNVDAETPELAIAVRPEHRGHSIGTQLIKALADTLKERGYSQLSLSVQKQNPALRLYLRTGFKIINENDEDYSMVLDLR